MIWTVATFYKFTPLPHAADLCPPLLQRCHQAGICGTILLAPEGINATVAGSGKAIEDLLQHLQVDLAIGTFSSHLSTTNQRPFTRMKVKLKAEIVTLGRPEANPTQRVGAYVAPEEWNQLITDPDVLVLDTRNEFEVKVGTFKGAVNPHTRSFREFPDYVQTQLDPKRHQRIAMFCTGGIRCEKATSYLLSQGFKEVYHLQGGILGYLKQVPEADSLWAGECYVFDDRVTVDHRLAKGHYEMCLACGHPVSQSDLQSAHYQLGVACPHCYPHLTPTRREQMQAKHQQRQIQKQAGTALQTDNQQPERS